MTTTTEALRLAREALTWLHDMAAGGKSVGHLYEGDCPDDSQPDSRDPGCPACKAMDKARAALSAIDQAQAAPVGAPSVEPVALHAGMCSRCGKWAGAHATLPGQPRDHLCMCATPQAQPATPPAVQAPLPARFVQFTLRDLKAERKRLDGFLSLGNEIGRAAEYDEWIAALEAFAAAHGIGAAAQGDTQ